MVKGLNPCCNGIYLIIAKGWTDKIKKSSLNPCCNGIYLIIPQGGQMPPQGGQS